MLPPPIPLLQVFNALIAGCTMLNAMLSVSTERAAGWSAANIGTAMMCGNLGYALLVPISGRLAERVGRVRMALTGALVVLGGCVLCMDSSPWSAAIGTALGMVGAALFFPGNAGLFSDREGATGGQPLPLHRKISSYNLGWSIGNAFAFAAAGLTAALPPIAAHGLAAAMPLTVLIVLWPWRSLPPLPPKPEGDRADHPALNRLVLTGRIGLLLACITGFSLIALTEKAAASSGLPDGRSLASAMLTAYALGFISTFIILGRWAGWILRPWRIWWYQSGMVFGTLALLAVGLMGVVPMWLVAICGAVIGAGYGAAYTASIYYSLRRPQGASQAAGLHEMALGIGNVLGPLLAGLLMDGWRPDLVGLSVFAAVSAVLCLLVQVALIPAAVRLGAR